MNELFSMGPFIMLQIGGLWAEKLVQIDHTSTNSVAGRFWRGLSKGTILIAKLF
jgi:hypothetical protein